MSKYFSELVRAMNFVINQGWVMYWGTARWSPSEVSIRSFFFGSSNYMNIYDVLFVDNGRIHKLQTVQLHYADS